MDSFKITKLTLANMDQSMFEGDFSYFALFDYCIVLLAIFANCAVLCAVLRCSFILTGYRRFLISLIASDLYFCFVNMLTFLFQIVYNNPNFLLATGNGFMICGANLLRVLQLIGFFLNLLNLCGMSLDHFIGVVYPIQYHYLMTKSVAKLAVGAIWCTSFSFAIIDITVNLALYNSQHQQQEVADAVTSIPDVAATTTLQPPPISTPDLPFIKSHRSEAELMSSLIAMLEQEDAMRRENETAEIEVCTFHHDSKMWFECCIIAMSIVCCIFLTICYSVVIKKVSHNADVTGRQHVTRKLVITTVMLIGVFMFCWMPFSIWELVMFIIFKDASNSNKFASFFEKEQMLTKSLLVQQLLNSILRTYPLIDPLIYAARIPAVRQYVLLQLIRHFKCCFCCVRHLNYQNRQSLIRDASSIGMIYRHHHDDNPNNITNRKHHLSLFLAGDDQKSLSMSPTRHCSSLMLGRSSSRKMSLTVSLVCLDAANNINNRINSNNRFSLSSFRLKSNNDNNSKLQRKVTTRSYNYRNNNHLHFGSNNNLTLLVKKTCSTYSAASSTTTTAPRNSKSNGRASPIIIVNDHDENETTTTPLLFD